MSTILIIIFFGFDHFEYKPNILYIYIQIERKKRERGRHKITLVEIDKMTYLFIKR